MNAILRSTWTLERWLVLAALLSLGMLSWLYLWAVPMPMPNAAGSVAPAFLLLTFLMWFVMMLAMMTPAVLPVVLLFQRVAQQSDAPVQRTLSFAGGYFTAWCVFSLGATVLQVILMRVEWVDAMGVTTRSALSAGLLAIVGMYQWLPIKNTCLDHCRSPVEFMTRHFRPGLRGAWRMGLHHGLYCIGCCGLLMLLLFIGGVMNLLWVAGIALLVSAEKLLKYGRNMQRLVGAALVMAAIAMWVRAA